MVRFIYIYTNSLTYHLLLKINIDFHSASRESIIFQGRLYISRNYVCFRSTVLPHVPHIIPFKDIVQIKLKTHMKLQNSISIETDTAYYFFTHLVNRKKAFDLVESIFRYQPSLKSFSSNAVICSKHEIYEDICADCISGQNRASLQITGRAPAIEIVRKIRAIELSCDTKVSDLMNDAISIDSAELTESQAIPLFSNRITFQSDTFISPTRNNLEAINLHNSPPIKRLNSNLKKLPAISMDESMKICDCVHSGDHVIKNEVINMGIESVWQLLYTNDSNRINDRFQKDHESLCNMQVSDWTITDDFEMKLLLDMPTNSPQFSRTLSGMKRKITYIKPLNVLICIYL